jgi:uncharacterized damage-inducible protein DinB
MTLQDSSENILHQLTGLIDQLSDEDYARPLPALSGSSIGGHVRHIVEFYSCLLKGIETGIVNYDKRPRSKVIENDTAFTVQVLSDMIMRINHKKNDQELQLVMDLSVTNSISNINTTFYRELAYNIEHAIHHMAIIKIATQIAYPSISIDRDFGVAYSTLNYQKQKTEKACVR